jgi:CRISPR-associated endonuclease/helicase Cas3
VDLAVSTLRGQMADNRAWSADPSRPAVICGTVDMIGSRLLFSGYGQGFKTRPLHAGFLGQDALLVHDEAHLEPAFQALVERIRNEQLKSLDPWKLRVMALTATSRGNQPAAAFSLGPADLADPVVRKRVGSAKRIHLHETGEKELANALVERALGYGASGRAVIVFVRTVDLLAKVSDQLAKAGHQVATLSGTMRGHERDLLVAEAPADNEPVSVLNEELARKRAIFGRFLPGAKVALPGTVYLVSTSAGEVGVNISADDLVCDLSTFESMAQRLGRVNRFGERTDTEVHIFHPPGAALDAESPLDAARVATLELLRNLNGDGSPRALEALPAESRRAAFAPEPELVPATSVLFDAWAMTTIRTRMAGRPHVEPYLHGIAEWEPPRTYVAFRDEVALVRGDLLETYAPADLLEDYPLKPHELLSDTSKRIAATFEEIASRFQGAPEGFPIWLISSDNADIAVLTLQSIMERAASEKNGLVDVLAGATVLLSPRACRPVGGHFVSDWPEDGLGDVSERNGDMRRRLLSQVPNPRPPLEDMRRVRVIVLDHNEEGPSPEGDDIEPRYWVWFEKDKGGDSDGSATARRSVLLEVHSADVEREAERITAALALDEPLKRCVVVAARLHDIGKSRGIWQRSIGNVRPPPVLAKAGPELSLRSLTRYRHELGSILDATADAELQRMSPELQELTLHIVAAHHGRARPNFPVDELFDPERPAADMALLGGDTIARFGRLQERYGRWGLAYIESLLRAADYAASQAPSSTLEVPS